jgi:hypothetical protein
MCLKWLKKQPADLPHPEEPQDLSNNVANTDCNTVLDKWCIQWQVPQNQRIFWKLHIVIQIYDRWPSTMLNGTVNSDTPAFTWEQDGVRHLASLASWFNPGVIAHEQAHNSYALLSLSQKSDFAGAWLTCRSDPYQKLLMEQRSLPSALWGDQNIEMHAEIYRYLGNKMPDKLKRYYPRLF